MPTAHRLSGNDRLMLITHPSGRFTCYEQGELFYKAGGTRLQLRMKDRMCLDTAHALAELCRLYPARKLCINDSLEVALACGAHELHLGKSDLPVAEALTQIKKQGRMEPLAVGATANTLSDLLHAQAQGATYIGLGPYRYTDTKKRLSPILGLDGYRTLIRQCREEGVTLPILAVGGIRLEDVAPLLEAGVDGIAVSGAIVADPSPALATRRFLTEIRRCCPHDCFVSPFDEVTDY